MPMYPDPAPPLIAPALETHSPQPSPQRLSSAKTQPEALAWGPINSMNVVQYVGCTSRLTPREELLKYLESRPEDYVAKKIGLRRAK